MAIDVWADRRQGNMGGILSITLIPHSHITQDNIADFVYENEMRVYFTRETAQHKEIQDNTESGELIKKSISFAIPKFRQEVLDYFAKYTQYYVLLVEDANGITRKVGTKKRPLRLAYDTDTAQTYKGKNEITVRLEGLHFVKSNKFDLQKNSADFDSQDFNSQDFN